MQCEHILKNLQGELNDDFPLFVAAISAGDDVSHVDGIFCRLKWRERSDANNAPSHQRRLNNQVAFIKTQLSFFFDLKHTSPSDEMNEFIDRIEFASG